MKWIFSLIFSCFLTISWSQTKFFKVFTSNGHDFGEGITELPSGGYLITGSSTSFSESPANMFLLELDENGHFVRSHHFGGEESDWGRRVFYVENDGVYVAGHTNSIGQGSFDFSLWKTNRTGDLLAQKTVGTTGLEQVRDAVMLKDTSFVMVGFTTNGVGQSQDAYLVRMKKNGDTLWTKKWGDAGEDIAHAVSIINDTTLAVVGNWYNMDSSRQKGFIQIMHIDGTLGWFRFVGGNGDYAIKTVAIHDNKVKTAGIRKVDGFDNEWLVFVQYYLNGNLYEERSENNDGNFGVEHIVPYGDSSKFYIVHQTSNTAIPSYPGGGEDILIYGYNEYFYWIGPYTNPSTVGHDQANEIIRTSDGGAILVGYNSHFYGEGGNNVIVLKIGPNDDMPTVSSNNSFESLVSLEENTGQKVVFYPNPVQDVLTVDGVSGKMTWKISDMQGRVIQTRVSDQVSISLAELASGMYQVEITQEDRVFRTNFWKR